LVRALEGKKVVVIKLQNGEEGLNSRREVKKGLGTEELARAIVN